jgi:hypothetical protein
VVFVHRVFGVGWSAEAGSIPVGDVDTEHVEEAGLEPVGPGDELDGALTGGEGDSSKA